MTHTESYSRVNVIRVNGCMRCSYGGCVSLCESGIIVQLNIINKPPIQSCNKLNFCSTTIIKGNHTTLENSINVFYPKTLLVIKHQKHVILKIGERKTKLENYKTKNLKLLNPDKEYSSKELSSIKNTVSKNSYSGNHYYGDSWTLDFILTEDHPNKRYLARLVELGSVDIKFGIYKCNKIDF